MSWGRTQHGNNNAYCHNSALSWYDWEDADVSLLRFTQRLIALRRAHPVFQRRRWFVDGAADPAGVAHDIDWYRPDGAPMTAPDWHRHEAAAVAVVLSGDHLVDADGRPLTDDTFCICLNALATDLAFRLPGQAPGSSWSAILDTAVDDAFALDARPPLAPDAELRATARSDGRAATARWARVGCRR